MRLSKKQREDLDSCLYFLPGNCKAMVEEITDEDIESYFAWSDRGDKAFQNRRTTGATAIRWGKTYRELFVTDCRRDLDTYIFIWELAKEDPDMPEKVVASLGPSRLNQFRLWKDIYKENPDIEWHEVLSDKVQELVSGKINL